MPRPRPPIAGRSLVGPAPGPQRRSSTASGPSKSTTVPPRADRVQSVKDDIESVLNSVDFIYRRDCGITYLETAIIVQVAEPDPYSSSNPGTLLGEFADYWNANNTAIVRDVAHLFTGKDIHTATGGVIGIAYLPGVCTATDGFGLVESRFSATISAAKRAFLSAHELGHNWNSYHCNQSSPVPCTNPANTDCGIMCSSLSGCSQSGVFEPCSAGQIIAYRDTL